MDVQFTRHCLRHRDNGPLPLPARLTRHWQQHEYVMSFFPLFLYRFSSFSKPPPIHHLKICPHLPQSTLPFLKHPTPPKIPPLTASHPSHSLTTSNPRLLHRRLLHCHRHKRSAMVRRRPQKLQRSRRRISRRRRRARLRRG